MNSFSPFGCSPSSVMPLMEIARTESTLPQVIVDLIGFGRKFMKTPIVVSDWKGHGVNSMFITYMHAAMLLAELGVDAYQIDQALKSFGMQFGPFRYAGYFVYTIGLV